MTIVIFTNRIKINKICIRLKERKNAEEIVSIKGTVMKKMKQYVMQICICLCLIIALSVYCTIQFKTEGKQVKIGVTYMTLNNTFYQVITNEIEKVVNEKNDLLYVRDPALSEEKQIEQINDFIKMEIDYLIINPVNSSHVERALQEAKDEGIHIIVIDAPLENEELSDCTIVSNNYDAGVQCAKHMMAHLEQAKIVLLEHNSVISAVDRIQGFLDTIQEYPQYQVIARADCLGQTEIALPKMREIIAEDSDFQVVMALNDPSALGALAALEESHLDHVLVYGVDGSPDMKKLISSSDSAMATASQSPIQMGKEAIQAVYRIENKKSCEKEVIIPVSMIEKNNINEYAISGWQ